MNPYLDDARQEIKRVDHLVYVSLKYTRTVDVIKSVVDRIISTIDFISVALLEDLKEKKIITGIPISPGGKINILEEHFKGNAELQDYLAFYVILRKIARAEYAKREEYRRHVTMIASLDDGSTINVDIDLLKEYYEKTKSFLSYAATLIEGKRNE